MNTTQTMHTLPKDMHGICIAALVDAAFRKAGVPELLAALEKFHAWSQDPESTSSDSICEVVESARAAIQKARGA